MSKSEHSTPEPDRIVDTRDAIMASAADTTALPPDLMVVYAADATVWVRDMLQPRLARAGLRAVVVQIDDAPRGGDGDDGTFETALRAARGMLLIVTPGCAACWPALERGPAASAVAALIHDGRLRAIVTESCTLPYGLAATAPLFDLGAQTRDDAEQRWRWLLTSLGAAPSAARHAPPTRASWRLDERDARPRADGGRAANDETAHTTLRQSLTRWLTDRGTQPLLLWSGTDGIDRRAVLSAWLQRDVSPADWPRVIWWRFGMPQPAAFERFIEQALDYVSDGCADIANLSPRLQVEAVADALEQQAALLVLDGFETELRAPRPNHRAESHQAVANDDVADTDDDDRDHGDADDDAEEDGRNAAGAERRACGPCVCRSPLAARFLRRIGASPTFASRVLLFTDARPSEVETPDGTLQAWCSELRAPQSAIAYARDRRRLSAARASRELSAGARALLEALAQARGPVDAGMLSRLAPHIDDEIAPALAELLRAGLVTPARVARDAESGEAFELSADARRLLRRHPIHPRPAATRIAIHAALQARLDAAPEPAWPRSPADLADAVEACHHAARAGRHELVLERVRGRIALALFHLARRSPCSAHQTQIDLLLAICPACTDAAAADGWMPLPLVARLSDRAWVLGSLAWSYGIVGQPRHARAAAERALELSASLDAKSLARALAAAAEAQAAVGALQQADTHLRRALVVCGENAFREQGASNRLRLGQVLSHQGRWDEADRQIAAGLWQFEYARAIQNQGAAWAQRAQTALWRDRSREARGETRAPDDRARGLDAARKALAFAETWAEQHHPLDHDFARAHRLLAAALRVTGDLPTAARHIDAALVRCRRQDLADQEAAILAERVQLLVSMADAGLAPIETVDDAWRDADEALAIARRRDDVLTCADVHLARARLASVRGEADRCRHHAAEALRCASGDGAAENVYRVASDEATRLLQSSRPG